MKRILTLLCVAMLGSGAWAAGYKESKSGDFSDDGLHPTKVKLKLGDNVIDADFGTRAGAVDLDYFVVKVPAGQQLSAIVVHPSTEVGGNSSFIGVQRGKSMTVDPNNPTAGALLGWAHFTTSDEGSDILPRICTGAVAQGCTPPLGPGTYTFWMQELSACECHYRLVFKVAARTK